MKISHNWLSTYLDIRHSHDEVSEMLTSIGLEVEGMEEIESVKGGLAGIVVGYVQECQKHPNADKLSLTKVDVGQEEALQIVCGAPNVAQGQKVVVATVGTTLYTEAGEPFKIKKGKIRGEVSAGMICAEDELGLGTDHSGIIVLPEDVPVGTLAKDYFKIETDVVYEIGLTPNRSDATAHIGVARDLAAFLKVNHEYNKPLCLPEVSSFSQDDDALSIEVVVENTEACPRYSGLSLTQVKVGDSPDWLKNRLLSIGIRPINNIVDITNFILHEYGQPLHAFDADKIAGQKVIVKTLKEGTPFVTLDEQERKLHSEDLMICDGNGKGMCIAGVFGGIDSGVTEQTTRLFLESAHFDPIWVRRTSTRHLLRTDAAACFEKGSDPNVTVQALKRAALLIKELAGGHISSEVIDIYPQPVEARQIDLRHRQVKRLIGVDISPEEIKEILTAMDMEIVSEQADGLRVKVPTDKADVTREVDVIEEILRIYGFNKVEMPERISNILSSTDGPDKQRLVNTVSDLLSANGFHEMMGLSLTESRYYRDVLPIEESELVFINNTSNVHLDVMRADMLFSGLEAIVRNQNRQHPDVRLYEFGKTYRSTEESEEYAEKEHLSLFITGRQQSESWYEQSGKEADYHHLKAFTDNVLQRLGISGFQQTAVHDEQWAFGLRYHRGPQPLVTFGKLHPAILKKMEIRKDVYYADFQWDNILKARKKHKLNFQPLVKYPSMRRDLALVIENSIKFEDIVTIARKTGKKLLKDINLFDVYENAEQLGEGKKSYAVSFVFENPERTLKDKEIDKIMKQLIQKYESDLGAVIRR
ncbi:MAG: phenylalanine--tRNA ligase subunit beta [Bacteroidota bacterium]